jgi:hypothetical protein
MSLRSLLPRIMHRGWTGSNAIHTFSALITRGTRNYCPCTSNTNEHLETLSWSRNLQLSMKELYPWKKMLLHDAVNVLAIGCTRMPDGTAAQAHHPLIQIAIFLYLPHQLLYLFPPQWLLPRSPENSHKAPRSDWLHAKVLQYAAPLIHPRTQCHSPPIVRLR